MKTIIALFIVALLAACGEEPVSLQQQEKNKVALAAVTDGDVLLCERGTTRPLAMIVNYTSNERVGTINGYVIEGVSILHDGNKALTYFARQCHSIEVYRDKTSAAEIIGKIVLGTPTKKPDLLVAPNGSIVKIQLFDGRIAGFYGPGIEVIKSDDPRHECAFELAKQSKSYDAKLCAPASPAS